MRPEPKFKSGDKVKILDLPEYQYGSPHTITVEGRVVNETGTPTFLSSSNCWDVCVSIEGYLYWFFETELELVSSETDEETIEESPKIYNDGDKVTLKILDKYYYPNIDPQDLKIIKDEVGTILEHEDYLTEINQWDVLIAFEDKEYYFLESEIQLYIPDENTSLKPQTIEITQWQKNFYDKFQCFHPLIHNFINFLGEKTTNLFVTNFNGDMAKTSTPNYFKKICPINWLMYAFDWADDLSRNWEDIHMDWEEYLQSLEITKELYEKLPEDEFLSLSCLILKSTDKDIKTEIKSTYPKFIKSTEYGDLYRADPDSDDICFKCSQDSQCSGSGPAHKICTSIDNAYFIQPNSVKQQTEETIVESKNKLDSAEITESYQYNIYHLGTSESPNIQKKQNAKPNNKLFKF